MQLACPFYNFSSFNKLIENQTYSELGVVKEIDESRLIKLSPDAIEHADADAEKARAQVLKQTIATQRL